MKCKALFTDLFLQSEILKINKVERNITNHLRTKKTCSFGDTLKWNLNNNELFYEGLNGVNRQPSNAQKINRQPSKMDNFNRQPSNKPGIITRQTS